MLKISGKGSITTCDGITRRDFLQVGTLGALGFSMARLAQLEALGATVSYHDPHVPVIPLTREHACYAGRQSVAEISPSYDLILLATGHDEYKSFDFTGYPIPLVDTRNAVPAHLRPANFYRA